LGNLLLIWAIPILVDLLFFCIFERKLISVPTKGFEAKIAVSDLKTWRGDDPWK
jgi:hypothetical protein